QARARGATGGDELLPLRDLRRVVERLEMRGDHAESPATHGRVGEHPAAFRYDEPAEERRRGRVETGAYSPDLDLLVDPHEQTVADREPDIHLRRIAAGQLCVCRVADREEAIAKLSGRQRLAQLLRVVERDGGRLR